MSAVALILFYFLFR